jgi:hypothetical protein
MTCASCGAEIADRAIVCYRCGAPTPIPEAPEALAPQAPAAPRRRVLPWIAVADSGAAVAAVFGLGYQDSTGAWLIAAGFVLGSVALASRFVR